MDAYSAFSKCWNRYYTEKTGGLDMDGQEKYVAITSAPTRMAAASAYMFMI